MCVCVCLCVHARARLHESAIFLKQIGGKMLDLPHVYNDAPWLLGLKGIYRVFLKSGHTLLAKK